MTAHDRLTETHGLRGVTVIRCPECDAGEPCQLVRESGAIARPENGDGAEGAPSPMRDEPAPSPDDPHGAYSRVLVGMAVERDKARSSAAAASERHEDDIRRLLDCREVVRSLTAERDASRTAHAALVADLRALVGGDELVSQRAVNPDEYTRRTGDRVPSYLAFYQGAADLAAVIRALLDRHAPTTGETP